MFARGRGGSTRGRGTGAEVGRAEAWPMSQAVVRKSQRAFSARPTNTPVGGPSPPPVPCPNVTSAFYVTNQAKSQIGILLITADYLCEKIREMAHCS